MFNLIYIILMLFFISFLILKIAMFISFKKKNNLEKMSPFECGFDPISSSRIPFSLQFFMITIIFVIFDVELVLLLPMVKTFLLSKLICWIITSILLIYILLIGIYYEWYQGALDWMN